MIRNISQRLATQLLEAGASHMPNQSIITAIIRVAWASAAGNLGLSNGSPAELHDPFKTNNQKISTKEDDIALACEAIEVLAFAIALHPQVSFVLEEHLGGRKERQYLRIALIIAIVMRFISNFDTSFYLRVILKSKRKGL